MAQKESRVKQWIIQWLGLADFEYLCAQVRRIQSQLDNLTETERNTYRVLDARITTIDNGHTKLALKLAYDDVQAMEREKITRLE